MNSVYTITFVHPVLLTATGVTAVAVAWLAPASLRAQRWWSFASIGIGLGCGALLAATGIVPWLGALHLAIYAVCMIAGFLLAWLLLRGRAALIGMSPQMVLDCMMIAVVLGVIGARLRYVYERWDHFLADAGGDVQKALVVAADLDRGGAVWYGGLLLATVGIMGYLKWRRIAWLPAADVMVPAVLAGLAVGRIGCWFNGCCYGAPTDLPWAVTCAHYPGQLVHPTQLYETVACAILASFTWVWWRRRRIDGQVTVIGLVGYGVWRFTNEGLRGDHDVLALGGRVTTSQLTSLWLIAGGVILAVGLWWWRRRHPEAAERAKQVPGSIHARSADGGHNGLPSP